MNRNSEDCLKLIEILGLSDEDANSLKSKIEYLDDFKDYRLRAILSNSFSEKYPDVVEFYKQLMAQRKANESSHVVMHEVEKLRINFVSLQKEVDALGGNFVNCINQFSELNGKITEIHDKMVEWEKTYVQLKSKVSEL